MKKKKGVILDIDGVLIHGVAPIPGARDALQRLEAAGLPTAFVTNGGGVPRQEKAKALGKTLQMPEEHFAARLCAAHDPIPELLRARGVLDQRVLVLSKSEALSRGVAREWQLKEPVFLEDFVARAPWLWPLCDDGREVQQLPQLPRVAAICVVATPQDWGQTLQLCIDLLTSGGLVYPTENPPPQPILIVSNPDFDYRARAPLVRMTTGAWLRCLETLYAKYSSKPLEYVIAGKPHRPIYDLAKSVLGPDVEQIYCVGDNPGADIRGAIDNGFIGVLVLTGCASENDPEHPADFVVADVASAVDLILSDD